ncbi:uncharacterized protein [Diadema antillarum]|uniref:uncharacterized protein n=1 Tax=Diadema antillarum TaxID=105358 RepID=UPI003A860643
MNGKEKKVLRFLDNDSVLADDRQFDSALGLYQDITLRSSIGSPIAASSVARPLLHHRKSNPQDLDYSHAQFYRPNGSGPPDQTGNGNDDPPAAPPDSARSRTSYAPSELTDTSLGILNLDDLASGLEELDDEFMDLSQDPNSPRSGIGDGEEMAPPAPIGPAFSSQSPREGQPSRLAFSQMSAPSIMFYDNDSQEDDSHRGIASDLSEFEGQATPVPGARSQTQGSDGIGSSEIDTEDEINAVRQEISQRQHYVATNLTSRLGVGEGRDDNDDDDDDDDAEGGALENREPRLQLDGGSSEDDDPLSATLAEPRQSAEGEVVILDPGDGGGGGDGMSDGETTSSGVPDVPVTFGQSTLMAFHGQGMNGSSRDWTLTASQFDGDGAVDGRARSRNDDDNDDDADDEGDGDDENRAPHMNVFTSQSRVQPIGETDIWDQGSTNFGRIPSPQRQSSLNHRQSAARDTAEANFHSGMSNHFMASAPNPFDDGPFSNENGLAVADAGFESQEEFFGSDSCDDLPFQNRKCAIPIIQDKSLTFDLSLSPDDAMAMIEKDEEIFEEENIFRQDEHMSHDQGDHVENASAWELPDGSQLSLRMSLNRSRVSPWEQDAKRVSLGTFIGMRSEALGSLSEDVHSGKPNFGDGTIISPPPRPPVAWVNSTSNHDNGGGAHSDESDDVYAASEREAGVGQYTHDASPTIPHRPSSHASRSKNDLSLDHTTNNERLSLQSVKSNSSLAALPIEFPDGGERSPYRNSLTYAGTRDTSNFDLASSQAGADGGQQTPPLDITSITAAIAQASSTANPQQLAEMILKMSKQRKAADDLIHRRDDMDAESNGVAQRAGNKREPKLKDLPNSRQKRANASAGRERTSTNSDQDVAEAKQRTSQTPRPPVLNGGDRSSSSIDRSSLDGSGGSVQEGRDSGTARVTLKKAEKQKRTWRKSPGSQTRVSGVTDLVLRDRESKSQELEGDHGDQAEKQRQPQGVDKHYEKRLSSSSGDPVERSIPLPLKDADFSQDSGMSARDKPSAKFRPRQQEIHVKETRHNALSGRLVGRDQGYSRQPAGGNDYGGRLSTIPKLVSGTIPRPQISENAPVALRRRPEEMRSGDTISGNGHMEKRQGDRNGVDRNEYYARLKSGRDDDLIHQQENERDPGVECRSEAIPDGEPTRKQSAASSKLLPMHHANGVGRNTPVNRNHQRSKSAMVGQNPVSSSIPRRHRKSFENSSSIERMQVDRSFISQNDCGVAQSPEGKISSNVSPMKLSFLNGVETGLQNSQMSTQHSGYVAEYDDSINFEVTRNEASRVPESFDDASRFSIDSQADIVIGKHRIKQTPRERRTVSQEQEKYSEQYRKGSSGDRRDFVSDAEADSGFSSEHPQRISGGSTDSRMAAPNMKENCATDVSKHPRTVPEIFTEDVEFPANFSALSREIISPTPSPRHSPKQSPIPSTGQMRTSLDLDHDRTLVAETDNLSSPRSNRSSQSPSRTGSVSSNSSSMSSTPKRKTEPELRSSTGRPPVLASGMDTVVSQTILLQPHPQPHLHYQSVTTAPDLAQRPISAAPLGPSRFYTNQALSDTALLSHYVNDKPISRLSPTSLHSLQDGLPQPAPGQMGLQLGPIPSHTNLYLTQHASQRAGVYVPPPQSLSSTVPTAAALTSVYYTMGVPAPSRPLGRERLSPDPTATSLPATILPQSDYCGIYSAPLHPNLIGFPQSIVSELMVPPHHRFHDVACIGIAAQDSLQLHNPSSRWLQCTVEVVALSINGEELPPEHHRIFVTQPRLIIGPQTWEYHKVLFAPRQPGIHEATIQVGSSPVVADSEVGLVKVTAPLMTTVRAVAELPEIEVEGTAKSSIDFGQMVLGAERSKVVHLMNRGLSSIPVRLFFVNTTSASWYGASMQTSDNQAQSTTTSPGRPLHITLPGRSTGTVDGDPGQRPAIAIKLWTQQKGPRPDSHPLGPPEDVHIDLKIELDVPDRIVPLADLKLTAEVGIAKLHLPDSLARDQALRFSALLGSSMSRNLPLLNAGNLMLDLRLRVGQWGDCFKVLPDSLVLAPSQERDVVVSYSPKQVSTPEEVPLLIQVRPDGPNFKLILKGEGLTKEKWKQKSAETRAAPPLLCNKSSMVWGGVPLGKSLKLNAILRNTGSETLPLKLTIRGSEDFQLLSRKGAEEKFSSSRQVVVHGQEDYTVNVVFTPTQLECVKGTLDIKPINSDSKYTLPLSGYGGVSNLSLEDVKLRGDMYSQDMGALTPGQHTVHTIKVRNVGLRAAFVKVMCFSDPQTKAKLTSSHLNVEPNEFVISPKMSKTLTVIYNPQEADFPSPHDSQPHTVAAVGLFYGDEVLRRCYRRCKPSDRRPHLSADNPLRGVSFDVKFLGEEHAREEISMAPEQSVRSLFYSSMSKVMLSLVGRLKRRGGQSPEFDRNKAPHEEPHQDTPHGVVLKEDTLKFEPALVGQSQTLKLTCKNTSREAQVVKFLSPQQPFHIHHHTHTIRAKHFVRIPVSYRPKVPGKHQAFMVIQTTSDHNLVIKLTGECL